MSNKHVPFFYHYMSGEKKVEDVSFLLFKADRQLDGINILIKVVQELSLARDIETIQKLVVSTARLLTGADGATFVLREGDLCHYVDEEAISPLWKGKKFPLEACISGWAMLNKKSVTIRDIYKDPRIPVDAYRPTFVKSLAMVPIRTIDPIGAIGNYWSYIYEPNEEELELLQALADSTAVALENVRVYNELDERVRKRTQELEEANEAVRLLSLCDELTGLNNRRGFYVLASQEFKRARRVGQMPMVMFIDVDGLKRVNDELGHELGDQLIVDAAQVIKSTMRESDVVARLGGDEFCALALDDFEDSVRKRFQEKIDSFNKTESRPYTLSMSVGFASLKSHDETLDDLLARADKEMYIHKQSRKIARS